MEHNVTLIFINTDIYSVKIKSEMKRHRTERKLIKKKFLA